MKFHVLPGDSLTETFNKTNIEGAVIVCRECLIDGDVSAENLNDFWREREIFLNAAFPGAENSYSENVKSEFEKLLKAGADDEINLWFEYELFCQTNLWFCLWLLKDLNAKIFRVAPVVRGENDLWNGFGGLSETDLKKCFNQRIKFSDEEVLLGAKLWEAFRAKDFQTLEKSCEIDSECFPYLGKVIEAATELENRPEARLKSIIAGGETEFSKIFHEFNQTEGVYGFGDLQVKRIYDRIAR